MDAPVAVVMERGSLGQENMKVMNAVAFLAVAS